MYILKLKTNFSAAHKLKNAFDEKCNKDIHGHNFKVYIEIETNKLYNNMVVDFKFIKNIIDEELDHKFLNKILPFEPTAEKIAEYIQKRINMSLSLDKKNKGRFFNTIVEVEENEGASIRYIDDDVNFANWFSGFFAGEGYFLLAEYNKACKVRVGIGLRGDDIDILYVIRDYFKCGKVTLKHSTGFKKGRKEARWDVESRKDIISKIIPHFNRYFLLAKKRKDFDIFKKGVYLLENRRNGNLQGKKSKISDKVMTEFRTIIKDLKDNRIYDDNIILK